MSTNNSRSRDPAAGLASKKKECYTFEPQQWRRSVCKNCFRSLQDHPTEPPTVAGGNGKVLSPRTSPLLGTKQVPGTPSPSVTSPASNKETIALRKNETSPTARRRPKSDEFKQKTPSPRQTQRSPTSSGRRSPARSPSSSNTHRNSGSFSGQNRQNSTSSIDVKYVEELENDFFDLEDKYDGLCKEKSDLEGEIVEKCRTIEELQEDVESYKIKILQLERRIQHLEDDIRSYRERLKLPESDQASAEANIDMSGQQEELLVENEQLRVRLDEIEQLCQEVMEENDLLKEEQEEMQREIEEMHDHFQEDDTDTLRELKRDLETSNKNCRIFQFKLRKTERRYEQCENERAVLEDKLNRLEYQLYSENDVNLIRGLEEELRVAKEVSVRLNGELELVDEKRSYFEEDNKHLKEDLQDSEKRRKTLEGELSKCRQEIEKLKSIDPGTLMIPETSSSRKAKMLESSSREASFEEQSLQRELDAAKEREADLNEQLKFSEDEIKKLKRRLNDAEEGNDSLSKKLECLMSNKNLDDNDYEDLSIHAMKVQMELLDRENSTMRKKFLLVEKENASLINDLSQIKIKLNQGSGINTSSSDDKHKDLEMKISYLCADVIRLEADNRRLGLLSFMNQDSLAEQTKSMPPQYHIDSAFLQNTQNEELRQECMKMKEQIRLYDKQIKNIMAEVEQHLGSQIEDQKQLDLLLKYSEVTASFREQQKEIMQIRKQIDGQNEEFQRYKDFYEKESKREVGKRNETKSGLENASKAVLLEEIGCLKEEIDELMVKYDQSELRIGTLSRTISEKEMVVEDLLSDHDKNETELKQYIQNLLTKNTLLNDLLACVDSRADDLQAQFDRAANLEGSRESSSTTLTSTDGGSARTSQSGPVSMGSDNAFIDGALTHLRTPINLNDIDKIKFQLSCLERLLTEERKRTRIAEKQAEMVLKESSSCRLNDDSQQRKKEVEMLKRDLEERNEMLEEKDQNLQDIRARLDQTRKMNEALRTLLDKQDEGSSGNSTAKSRDGKESNIEINSYRKEISIMKSEMHQYAIKLSESEKMRDKLAKEIRNLQAEMKVREEQIYEQDDELRAKDQEIRTTKRLLEESQSQSQANNFAEEIKEKNELIETLTGEIEQTRKSLQNSKSHSEGVELELRQNQNQQKMLSDSIRMRDERIKEKDDLLSHLNQRLQNREKELTDFDSLIKETNEKLDKQDNVIKSLQIQLSKKELELATLKGRNDELQTSHDNMKSHLYGVTMENEGYRARLSELEKEKAKPSIVPRVTSSSSPDVEKLKNEVAMLKKDKETLLEKINRSQGTFSALKKDSEQAKSDSEAYTKAIQQQQYVTRVTLLTDNITRLNRANIELKLHNESIQNDMLEYQRRYKNIKEQYEAEEETWALERIVIESRMKEFEDRRSVLAVVRKALQDATLKVAILETQVTRDKQENEIKLAELDREKSDLQKKLARYEEKEKLPKVFQRFGGKMTSRTANEMVQDKEKTELRVKLEAAEKMIQKLRLEIVEKEEQFCLAKAELMNKSEETQSHLEDLVEDLSKKLHEMDGLKEQLLLLRERIFTLEEAEERDRKIWNEDRMIFQFKIEDSRMMIDNWLEKIKELKHDEDDKKYSTMEALEKDIEKYLFSKECIPYAQMCRKIQSQQDSSSTPASSSHTISVFGKPPMKSASLDWTHRISRSQVPPDHCTSNQSINATNFIRTNRSVSPDQATSSLTTKKITNYPDPTPGFLLRSSSRQSSVESVSRDSDYSQRSCTLPGMRVNLNASRISPARQRFFENTSSSEQCLGCIPSKMTESTDLEVKSKKDAGNLSSSLDMQAVEPVTKELQTKVQVHLYSNPQAHVDVLKKPNPQAKVQIHQDPDPQANVDVLKNPHPQTQVLAQKTPDQVSHKTDVKVTFSQPFDAAISLTHDEPKPISSVTKVVKPKSTSIAPSIQQLRMKFAQKSTGTSNSDSSTLKK